MKALIFGNAGSGKTTLARRFGAQHGLTVLDLDNVVWSPTEAGVFRPDTEIVADLAAFVREHPAWVIEGCYGKWMEHLSPHCTQIVFCNPPEGPASPTAARGHGNPTSSRARRSRTIGCRPCSTGCAPTTPAQTICRSRHIAASMTLSGPQAGNEIERGDGFR